MNGDVDQLMRRCKGVRSRVKSLKLRVKDKGSGGTRALVYEHIMNRNIIMDELCENVSDAVTNVGESVGQHGSSGRVKADKRSNMTKVVDAEYGAGCEVAGLTVKGRVGSHAFRGSACTRAPGHP